MLYDNKVKELYDPKFLEKPLAKKLFVEGIRKGKLTTQSLQWRFVKSANDDRFIFYPSFITCEIFNTIKNNEAAKFYLSCCRGVGKSFSLALFVYLFRKKENTRVFYVHNSEDFVKNPISYFARELWTAFPKEMEALKVDEKKLVQLLKDDFIDDKELAPGFPFRDFLAELSAHLTKMKTKVFVIFDQMNEIQKIKPSESATGPANLPWQIFNIMKHLNVKNRTSVLMSSATNEMPTRRSEQGCAALEIDLTRPPPEATQKFIKHRLGEYLEEVSDDQKYEKVEDMTESYFLYIHDFAVGYRKNKSLDDNISIFCLNKITELRTETERFLGADDIKDGNERKRTSQLRNQKALVILSDFINDTTSHPNLPQTYFDSRYLFRETKTGKLQALHSFVLDAYKLTFINPTLLNSMIKQFSRDKAVLGFVLANIILVYCRERKVELDLVSLTTFQKTGTKIKLYDHLKDKRCSPDSFDLDKPGLYIPATSNFALYDGFISQENKIIAIQITKTFSKIKIDGLINKKCLSDDPRKNTKDSVWKRLDEFLKRTKRSFETLLVSVGQKPEKDEAFASFQTDKKDETKNFFYVDALPILESLGLDQEAIQILYNPELGSDY